MAFFEEIRASLRKTQMTNFVIFLVLTAVCVIVALSIGFSPDASYQIGVRGSRSGIPIPDALLSGFILLVGAGFGFACFSALKPLLSDSVYTQLLTNAQKLGNPEQIGSLLQRTPKSTLAIGDLRITPFAIFYHFDTDAQIIHPAHIRSIQPKSVSSGKSTNYYVVLGTASGNMQIRVLKDKIQPLVAEIVRLADLRTK